MFDWRRFIEDLAAHSGGDYAGAFKMLGFVLYVGKYGADALLSGETVSLRTYYRYLETIRAAGWGSLVSELRFSQALREYLEGLGVADAEEVSTRLSKQVAELVEGVGA